MNAPIPLVDVQRGGVVESQHFGHAAICNAAGELVEGWGDPGVEIYPRSAVKMIQALPLVTSGAADRAGLGTEQLALACASHGGTPTHTSRVANWLDTLGLDDRALLCGTHPPTHAETKAALIRDDDEPCQLHNNCSGKHAGFLTLGKHLGAGPDYIDIDNPVQQAVRAAFEEATDAPSSGWGIDGCSAPNFRTTLKGLARAMAWMADGNARSDRTGDAASRLIQAMMAHPVLVSAPGRACAELIAAFDGKGTVKTGAEGVFVAILPEQGLGMALKITDGAARASECAISALLAHVGALSADHPAIRSRLDAPILNAAGRSAARITPAPGFPT